MLWPMLRSSQWSTIVKPETWPKEPLNRANTMADSRQQGQSPARISARTKSSTAWWSQKHLYQSFLTTSRWLTFIHAKLCLTDILLTSLVFVCVDRMTSISATCGQAHRLSRSPWDVTLGYPTTMNEFTLFMDVMPNPFIQDMFLWLTGLEFL